MEQEPMSMLDAFLSLIAGQRPDRLVWTADITYWIAGRKQAGAADPAWDTEAGYLQLHRDLGIFPYYYYEKFWAGRPCYGGRVEEIVRTDGNKTTRRFSTPAGDLVEESVYSPDSCSQGCVKHFVRTEKDLAVLRYILDHRRLEPDNLEDYPQRRELWRQYGGLPCIGMPRSPLASLCYEWAGVQSTAYLIADCRPQVEEVLQQMEEQESPVLEAVCRLAPPLVHFPDNLSSDNLTSLYDPHMAGPHRRRIERLHAAGVRCAVHLDGTVKGLLPKLIRSGFDAVEALTPRPAGDLDLDEILDLAGRQPVILWGGVPGVLFAPPFSWPQMEAHVRRLIDRWGHRPFVMGVADQVPPDGDIEFCRRIADLVSG
jgi:hypothetical protein